MQLERKVLIMFSPTGGTEKAARAIGDPWDLPEQVVDLTETGTDYSQYRFGGGDLCLIAVPAYGGRVPAAALERIALMRGTSSPAVLVASYGNRDFDDTLLELKHCVEKNGFITAAAAAVVTEHSIARQFGTGRPDDKDRMELKDFSAKVESMLEEINPAELRSEEMKNGLVTVTGNEPYRKYDGVPIKPRVNKKCTGCGLCAARCPVAAIDKKDCTNTDIKTCISCMRCIQICPNEARYVDAVHMKGTEMLLKKKCAGRKANQFFLPEKYLQKR